MDHRERAGLVMELLQLEGEARAEALDRACGNDIVLRAVIGSWVGPHRLLEQLGEGGFGTVFLAEQREPMVRCVALKIIKPGMDTRRVIAQFEAERQALAMMDHPNIARVFDAGATAQGGP